MARPPDCATDVFIDFQAFLDEIQAARLDRMPTYQGVVGSGLRASPHTNYKAHYFISHRWDTPGNPDPTRWQFEALRQFASELRSNEGLPSCFWYDFSSLPQGKRTPAEQKVFEQGLDRLNDLSVNCDTVALVSGSADPLQDFQAMLKRGWILCEMIVAHRSGRWRWWFHQGDSEIIGAAKGRTAQFQPLIENALREMTVHDSDVLLKWLEDEGVACTNKSDLAYLSKRIVKFGFELNRDPSIVLPTLQKGVVLHLSDQEVAKYFIDSAGRSPFLPGSVVTFSRGTGGGYDLVVQDEPPPPAS